MASYLRMLQSAMGTVSALRSLVDFIGRIEEHPFRRLLDGRGAVRVIPCLREPDRRHRIHVETLQGAAIITEIEEVLVGGWGIFDAKLIVSDGTIPILCELWREGKLSGGCIKLRVQFHLVDQTVFAAFDQRIACCIHESGGIKSAPRDGTPWDPCPECHRSRSDPAD